MNLTNSFKLFNTLAATFVTAGGLGFINYILLEKLDIIRYKKENANDKKLFIMFFSLVNYSLFLMIFKFPSEESSVNQFIIELAFGIIITLLISIILTFTIYPLFAFLITALLNLFRKYFLKKPIGNNLTEKERLFSEVRVSTYLYIFDFDKNKIAEGYLEGWLSDDDIKNQISLSAPAEISPYNFEEVQIMFSEQDNDPKLDTTRHLIDFDNKIHYFIFYRDN